MVSELVNMQTLILLDPTAGHTVLSIHSRLKLSLSTSNTRGNVKSSVVLRI